MWAPAKNSHSNAGHIVNIMDGWTSSTSSFDDGSYYLQAWKDTYSTANFDSGWLTFNSQNGTNSYKEVVHGLGVIPNRVKVLVMAGSGPNSGFIFHATGAAQNTDTTGNNYGGVVFAYNATVVRLWAPTVHNGTATGHIINVINGWGGEDNVQAY